MTDENANAGGNGKPAGRNNTNIMRDAFYIFLILAAVIGIAGYALSRGVNAQHIAILGYVAFSTVIIAFAAAVLFAIVNGSVSLYGIISEPDTTSTLCNGKPKASLSRFQFLVFTFVVAGLFLMLSIKAEEFVDIPNSVLMLIGLSGGGFIISKAVGHKPKDGGE